MLSRTDFSAQPNDPHDSRNAQSRASFLTVFVDSSSLTESILACGFSLDKKTLNELDTIPLTNSGIVEASLDNDESVSRRVSVEALSTARCKKAFPSVVLPGT